TPATAGPARGLRCKSAFVARSVEASAIWHARMCLLVVVVVVFSRRLESHYVYGFTEALVPVPEAAGAGFGEGVTGSDTPFNCLALDSASISRASNLGS